MPRLTGFEVLARLPIQPIVIFTTAFDQYALKAFGVNSVDYLLKPVEPDSLERALTKVERLRGSGTSRSRNCKVCSGKSQTRCVGRSRSIPTALRHGWATACNSSSCGA